jgi:Rieske Fe-S protein
VAAPKIKPLIRTIRTALANSEILLYSFGMKRREALGMLAGSFLAILPFTATNANQKRKTIYCLKDGKVRKVTGVNPSCPVGWRKTNNKEGRAAWKAQQNAGKNPSGNTTTIPNNWVRLTTLAALPNATATEFSSQNIWLIKNGNSVTGFSGRCTHQGTPVDKVGAGFRCPNHGATYDANGMNPTSPATRPLARVRIEVADGVVYLVN